MSRHRSVTISCLLTGALLAGACGGTDDASTPRATSSPTTTAGHTDEMAMSDDGHEMMPVPDEAKDWAVKVSSPTPGAVITTNELPVVYEPVGFELDCSLAGGHDESGSGHLHALLDGSLVDMYCGDAMTISMQNVDPGTHELELIPTLNNHTEVLDGATSVAFEYRPTAPLPRVTDEDQGEEPALRITSPLDGAVLSGEFDVTVEVEGFEFSCPLFGKDPVAGYGHWHVNWDTTIGPMMGMATMQGMSCTNTFRANTAGLAPGTTHSLIALLVDNGHMPLDPAVESAVEFTVG